MESRYTEAIADDDREVHNPLRRAEIGAKLTWYAVTRPVMDRRWRKALSPALAEDPVFGRVNMLLNGEGGMFKQHTYALCDGLRPLSGASVLVPGIGYAKNLMQLAAFRPKEITAFDLFGYPEIWKMAAEKTQADFGVPATFLHGDFDVVPQERKGAFDFVVSDAVLEHVADMPKFAEASRDFLKPGGIFYASFGPLWYGPSGDHVDWGEDRLFDHLLLPETEYKKQLSERSLKVIDQDSCDPGFMVQQDFFSHLKAVEYLQALDEHGFEILDLRAKIYPAAVRLLEARPQLHAELNARGVPAFDRFSGGMYIWARKR